MKTDAHADPASPIGYNNRSPYQSFARFVMQLGKIATATGTPAVVLIEDDRVHRLNLTLQPGIASLADILASPNPAELSRSLVDPAVAAEPLAGQRFLAPIDRQEVWAAGVTYKRSKIAREEESVGAAQFYDKVYTADRPELFLKASAERVVHPGDPVRVRADSKWSVPEPELALVISPAKRIVGYTIGNDMSARDIEGENPLYLPQAKIYRQSCAVGPVITLAADMPPLPGVGIHLAIRRNGNEVFAGQTTLAQMARSTESLVEWLGREIDFPAGAVLLTGTGIVPPDAFTLAIGDEIAIRIDGIGTLHNRVGA